MSLSSIFQPTNDAQPYRVADVAGAKVHSIQVGNVLQIVPTELQVLEPGSQPVSSHHHSNVSRSVSVPVSR